MTSLLTLIQDLIQIDSINPDLVVGGTGEGEIARFVAAWLERAGLDVTVEEVVTGRPNVVAVAKGSGGGKSLMLNAHMDTVGVAGIEQPFKPRVDGNRLYGRGAYDMKSSLAAIMLASAEAAKKSLRGDVILTAVIDEEYASLGTQAIAQKWKADAAIVTEPTELDICIAHKGFVWYEIETKGKAAHGSRYNLGVDAIAKMGKVLTGIEALEQQLKTGTSHPLLQHGSIHASVISGGQEWSSYPEVCKLLVERRTLPGETMEQINAQIESILNKAAVSDPQFKATNKMSLQRDAFEIEQDEAIVQTLLEQSTHLLDAPSQLIGLPFWMDSAILASANIPTVIFGPRGGGAHALEEWVDLDSVHQCQAMLEATIAAFCR